MDHIQYSTEQYSISKKIWTSNLGLDGLEIHESCITVQYHTGQSTVFSPY